MYLSSSNCDYLLWQHEGDSECRCCNKRPEPIQSIYSAYRRNAKAVKCNDSRGLMPEVPFINVCSQFLDPPKCLQIPRENMCKKSKKSIDDIRDNLIKWYDEFWLKVENQKRSRPGFPPSCKQFGPNLQGSGDAKNCYWYQSSTTTKDYDPLEFYENNWRDCVCYNQMERKHNRRTTILESHSRNSTNSRTMGSSDCTDKRPIDSEIQSNRVELMDSDEYIDQSDASNSLDMKIAEKNSKNKKKNQKTKKRDSMKKCDSMKKRDNMKKRDSMKIPKETSQQMEVEKEQKDAVTQTDSSSLQDSKTDLTTDLCDDILVARGNCGVDFDICRLKSPKNLICCCHPCDVVNRMHSPSPSPIQRKQIPLECSLDISESESLCECCSKTSNTSILSRNTC